MYNQKTCYGIFWQRNFRLKIMCILAGLSFSIITRVLLVCKLQWGKQELSRHHKTNIKEVMWEAIHNYFKNVFHDKLHTCCLYYLLELSFKTDEINIDFLR